MSVQLEAADALVPLVATACAHRWLRSEMRLSVACLTSSGLSGLVSRAAGSARTEGNCGAADDKDDEEHPDATTAGARQKAKTASTLAVTQLRPCIWAYPRYALARRPVARLKDRKRRALPLCRYNVYQLKIHQPARKEQANNRITL